MTRDTALKMMEQYKTICPTELDGYCVRFPADGGDDKAMRWLGFCQGMVCALGCYTLEELKEHSKRGWVYR